MRQSAMQQAKAKSALKSFDRKALFVYEQQKMVLPFLPYAHLQNPVYWIVLKIIHSQNHNTGDNHNNTNYAVEGFCV